MGRCLTAALALMVVLPVSASGQGMAASGEEVLEPGRVTITPYAGWRIRYRAFTDEVVEIFDERIIASRRVDVEGSPIVGLEASVPVAGRFAAVGALAYGFSAASQVITASPAGSSFDFSPEGGTFLFGKLGVSYQFLDRNPQFRLRPVAATASVAPALVRVDPPGSTGFLDDPINHFGFALSANGLIPLAPWRDLALNVSIEDFVTFWNTGEMSARVARQLGQQFDTTVRSQIDADPTHIVMLQAGVTVRF